MPVQPEPPITLDPSQDTGHQLAFINQNFQSIANQLSKNSFKVQTTGTITLTPPNSGSPNFTVSADNLTTAVVPHGLNYSPAILVYAQFPGNSDFSGLTPLPYTDAKKSGGAYVFLRHIYPSIDNTNISFVVFHYATQNYTAVPVFSFKYYILQETAN